MALDRWPPTRDGIIMPEKKPPKKVPSAGRTIPPLKKLSPAGHVLGELSALIFAGALLGFLYGTFQTQNRWTDAFNGAAIALASAAVGGLFGLLFGVPRALAGSPSSTNGQYAAAPTMAGTSASSSSPITASAGGYGANTNLEQVSDWLTKLLLGAGFTQFARLPRGLQSLGSYLAPGLGGGSGASSFAVVLVIYSLLVGFFLGWLAARLKLGAAFREADYLAQSKQGLDAQIDSLPPAPAGPTMLHVEKKATPADRRAAVRLSQQVQAMEQQTPGPAFGPDAYRRIAQELAAAKLYDRALQILNVGATEHPNDPSLPLYIGAIYGMYLDDYKSADSNYFKALAINPAYAPAFYNLACSAVRQDKLPTAHEYLSKAFAMDPRLRDLSTSDPVWDSVRDSEELKDLLPRVPE
jgi:tetratricopeptide (TPR) repeat protein